MICGRICLYPLIYSTSHHFEHQTCYFPWGNRTIHYPPPSSPALLWKLRGGKVRGKREGRRRRRKRRRRRALVCDEGCALHEKGRRERRPGVKIVEWTCLGSGCY